MGYELKAVFRIVQRSLSVLPRRPIHLLLGTPVLLAFTRLRSWRLPTHNAKAITLWPIPRKNQRGIREQSASWCATQRNMVYAGLEENAPRKRNQ
ncbi:MAG TPA: hypothetical protein DIT67_01800 [Octadecabacter sp.]|nr:hypothetical protein [Octadecabacter sp.]